MDQEISCSSKRQRLDYKAPVSQSQDYYDEALSDSPPLTSSWLRTVQWISSIDQEQDLDYNSRETLALLNDDIQTISRQLVQLKRRMGPAAERCCDSMSKAKRCTPSDAFRAARRACNPYEKLGEGSRGGLNSLLMNRSAIKLANMDAMLGFCLTSAQHFGSVTSEEPFLFVDVCGAPGGFSEYILRRCISVGIPCRGVGMSLMGVNETGVGLQWKLGDFQQKEGGSDAVYRVCLGKDGTGDIMHWGNVEALISMVSEQYGTNENLDEGTGKAHLVLSDGGFDSQRDSEDQEGITQKLIVCEVAAALALLRRKGTFLFKLFGFQTEVVRSVMRYLFLTFDSLIVVKPISSRPASAERYVVCSGFKGCPLGWTGPKWRDGIFLGRSEATSGITQDVQRFDHYLIQTERDLLLLNQKACNAILAYLQSRAMHGEEEETYATGDIDCKGFMYEWRLK